MLGVRVPRLIARMLLNIGVSRLRRGLFVSGVIRIRFISVPDVRTTEGRIGSHNCGPLNTRKHHGEYVEIKGDVHCSPKGDSSHQ